MSTLIRAISRSMYKEFSIHIHLGTYINMIEKAYNIPVNYLTKKISHIANSFRLVLSSSQE